MKKHTARGLTNKERRALVEIRKSLAVPAAIATRLQKLGLVHVTDRDDDFVPGRTRGAVVLRSLSKMPIACGRLTAKGLIVVQGC